MNAMLFAAGLGTRLQPLTKNKPKALVELNGISILEHNILLLKKAGIRSIVINVHHFSEQIIQFIKDKDSFGILIQISDESGQLLDTGGGLKKASPLFDNNTPILLQNADIISDINYNEMLKIHEKNNAIATLAVRKRISSRYLITNHKNNLIGWQNTKTKEVKWVNSASDNFENYAFSGIHIVSPKIFSAFPPESTFNIIQWYLDVAKTYDITTYDHTKGYWFDIGTIEKLDEAQSFLKHIL